MTNRLPAIRTNPRIQATSRLPGTTTSPQTQATRRPPVTKTDPRIQATSRSPGTKTKPTVQVTNPVRKNPEAEKFRPMATKRRITRNSRPTVAKKKSKTPAAKPSPPIQIIRPATKIRVRRSIADRPLKPHTVPMYRIPAIIRISCSISWC